MRNHLSSKELSAYLDGEARRPGAVSAHLEVCPECEGRYRELIALSKQLRSLPATKARPGFAARVLRALVEPTPNRIPERHPMRVAAFATAALFMSATMVSIYYANQPVLAPTPVAVSTPVAQSMTLAQQEEALVLELEQLMAEQPAYDSPLLAYDMTNEGEPTVATVDDMLLALMADDALLQYGQTWLEDEDFDTTVNKLDRNQTETLMSLLREYAEETNAI